MITKKKKLKQKNKIYLIAIMFNNICLRNCFKCFKFTGLVLQETGRKFPSICPSVVPSSISSMINTLTIIFAKNLSKALSFDN